MTDLKINNVNIVFPFQPYPCQMDYMQKVVECLQKSENAILESPTGTGKTVCLLCASLGWLQSKKAQLQSQRAMTGPDEGGATYQQLLGNELDAAAGGSKGFLEQPSKIIYSSRTHSQLTQAIQELRRTAYSYVKVGVLGSRDQLCIHEKVSQETSNSVKVNLCRAKVNSRTCRYYNNLDAKKTGGSFLPNVVDIEDLVKIGEKHRVCPYYMAKETKQEADILFMPYNYLLDPKLRKMHGVELQNNILIFDEAHNLENICEDSASVDLSSHDLATAIEELTELAEKLEEMVRCEDAMANVVGESSLESVDFSLEQLLQLKAALHHLEEAVDKIPFTAGQTSVTRAGVYIFELFESIGITFDNKNFTIELVDKVVNHLMEQGTSGYHSRGAGLSKIAEVLKVVFSQEKSESHSMSYHKAQLAKYFKVHVRQDDTKQKAKPKTVSDFWDASSKKGVGRVLSYWCFSSGHTMQELKSHGVKSIIVTSGTLSPLSSFTLEMQIPFPNTLENPHVIQPEQFMVATLCKGPDGTTLNSSYQTRFSSEYKSSLGNAIVNFIKNVPHGVLLFFPSYTVMNDCTEHWQTNGIWNRILQYKDIFVEPKRKDSFQQAMDSFYASINDPSKNGAVFAAVCRGKVSEGLDFADINGRAVIITGLPFPPMKDARVMLKMQFLDEMKRKKSEYLTGWEWYRQQATRAVNQAIGRVIRHKQDYGAILLCDTRFSSAESVSNLPAWVKHYVKKYDNFGHVLRDLCKFFKKAEEICPTPSVRPRKETASYSVPAAFMPSKSEVRKKLTVSKASHVENHLPSLLVGNAQVEEVLQSQYSLPLTSVRAKPTLPKRGLLDALDNNEKNEDDEPDTYFSRKAAYEELEQKSAVATKKKILLKCQTSTGGSASSYVARVKQVLSTESYNMFREAMKAYHSGHDYSKLVPVLAEIFTDEAKHHPLLIDFYRYVLPEHKKNYDELCCNITGQGCGFKPEHALSKKRLMNDEAKQAPNRTKRTKITVTPLESFKTKPHVTPSDCRPDYPDLGAGVLSRCDLGVKGEHKSSKTNTVVECCRVAEASRKVASCSTLEHNDIPVARGDNTASSVTVVNGKDNGIQPVLVSSTGSSDVHGATTADRLPTGSDTTEFKNPGDIGDKYTLQQLNKNLRCVYDCAVCASSSKNLGAFVPLQAPCGHICCMPCWKQQFESSRFCPVCQTPTRRRHLKALKNTAR